MYNLVPPSALSPRLSNVTVTLQNLPLLQDHLFYGAFTSEQTLPTVSVTSGQMERAGERERDGEMRGST